MATDMMTSSNGNIFCITGPLCGEFGDLRRHHGHYEVNVMETLHNIGLDNGLFPDGTTPLLEANTDFSSMGLSCIHSRIIFVYIHTIWIFQLSLKFAHLESQPHLPKFNEVIMSVSSQHCSRGYPSTLLWIPGYPSTLFRILYQWLRIPHISNIFLISSKSIST